MSCATLESIKSLNSSRHRSLELKWIAEITFFCISKIYEISIERNFVTFMFFEWMNSSFAVWSIVESIFSYHFRGWWSKKKYWKTARIHCNLKSIEKATSCTHFGHNTLSLPVIANIIKIMFDRRWKLFSFLTISYSSRIVSLLLVYNSNFLYLLIFMDNLTAANSSAASQLRF